MKHQSSLIAPISSLPRRTLQPIIRRWAVVALHSHIENWKEMVLFFGVPDARDVRETISQSIRSQFNDINGIS